MSTTLSERVVAKTSNWLARKTGRRSFLVTSAVVGSALAVNPLRYILKPGDAYAATGCGPGASCGSGWSAMCCSINAGQNTCPPGTIPGGWWKVDNSHFCGGGPRYYIDCNASCGSCGCGSSGVCSSACNNCNCHCNTGSCDQRAVCCNQFRYGQCNMDVCVGAVVCRVVSCSPPWEFDPSCSTVSATSVATALHDAPCLHGSRGIVRAFGAAPYKGEPTGTLRAPIVGMEATKTGNGYWLVASDGGVFAFGDAKFRGSTGDKVLNKPIVDLAATKSGNGYWLVASDGGIFTFGDARFFGSTGAIRLNKPIVGMAATKTGNGYWLVASDGGIFTFGDARFFGSLGGKKLNRAITGMAATPSGNGYWMVAEDGGIFTFGDARFFGAAGLDGSARAVDMARRPTNDGYWISGTRNP